jgi:hypothetical protein
MCDSEVYTRQGDKRGKRKAESTDKCMQETCGEHCWSQSVSLSLPLPTPVFRLDSLVHSFSIYCLTMRPHPACLHSFSSIFDHAFLALLNESSLDDMAAKRSGGTREPISTNLDDDLDEETGHPPTRSAAVVELSDAFAWSIKCQRMLPPTLENSLTSSSR